MKKMIFVIVALLMLLTACSSTSPASTQPNSPASTQPNTKPAISTESNSESINSTESIVESSQVPTEDITQIIETTEERQEPDTMPITTVSEPEETKTEPPIETTVTPTTTEFVNPFSDPGNWKLSTYNDYAHDSEIIILGNNEGVELSIEASKPNLTFDDFFVMYDEELLTCEEKMIVDSFKDKTILKYRITHTSPGTSEVFVVSTYEYIELGDECLGYSLTVRGLDKTDGKIVYVTPTGEKYHFSESCAGENAFATTLWDVRQYEYEPCGKCAK